MIVLAEAPEDVSWKYFGREFAKRVNLEAGFRYLNALSVDELVQLFREIMVETLEVLGYESDQVKPTEVNSSVQSPLFDLSP